MAQTVIGFFDNSSEAQKAVERLESTGISRGSIDVSNRGNTSTSVSDQRSDRDEDNGITRFFKSLFGSDDNEAKRYSRVAESSGSIVTVHARSHEEAEKAADILDDCGAIDVDERSAQYGSDLGRLNTGADTGSANRRETTIPRVEENLHVGKRTEERGGVRVRSRIVERPVEEHVRLRTEHVHVEREAVNRPITGSDNEAFRERNIELTERAEVPVVNKEARVVEEVRISKDVDERDETIRDTVRKTDIDVDRTGNNSRTGNNNLTDRNSESDERGRGI